MSGLAVEVDHRQGDFHLSGRFDAPRGVTALFGRSGSGKSTLVNVIAGLVRPDRGRVAVGETVLLDTAARIDLPRHRRGIGYVFQEGRLFPHLDVRRNLLFGRWFAPRAAGGSEFDDVVDLLGIGPLLARRPERLSGGEKQRVAIGRALLSRPRLLLMDEPLAALDDDRKAEILPYIERLRDTAAMPIVYVSHALPEVARLADTLVVLDRGSITMSGPAAALLASHEARALTGTREAGAVVEATVAGEDDDFGLTALSTSVGMLRVPRLGLPRGARLRLQIPARDVMLSLTRPDGLSALNVIEGIVEDIPAAASEPTIEVRILCSGTPLMARITRRSLVDLDLRTGMKLFAVIKSAALDTDRPRP